MRPHFARRWPLGLLPKAVNQQTSTQIEPTLSGLTARLRRTFQDRLSMVGRASISATSFQLTVGAFVSTQMLWANIATLSPTDGAFSTITFREVVLAPWTRRTATIRLLAT